ncbi:MAG: hypothetical protein IKB22_05110, partial [Lentisphaeria bacterium]|nr:hypothetical protein [Lentisphaeria bacterium]
MTFVYCSNNDCKYCRVTDSQCTKTSIFVGDGFDCGCSDLDPYYNSAEYNEKYYKCVKTKDGQLGKCASYGKRIEYSGRVFYTSDRITESGDYRMTDAESGYFAGTYRQLEDRFDALCEKAKNIPNVESLP